MVPLKFLRNTLVLVLSVVVFGTSSLISRADEGMWMFGNPPLKQLKKRYNFEPTPEWLDHVRLAAVRFSNGGSGGFVSPDGLVITNFHIARSLLAKLSTPERDLLKNGFYARTRAEELRCPDLELNVLISMEDVTQTVQAAARGATNDKDAETRRKAEIARIEKDSTEKTGLRSNVINLYEGGEYWLYRFKKYTDVRMVFSPEEQAQDFGGEYDNFTYPRHSIDFAFLRAYENDKPAKTEHYYRWSTKGIQENELIFVIGNPGSTDRLRTVAQIEFQRDVANSLALGSFIRRRKALMQFSAQGAEPARRASDSLSSINNTLKRLQGQQDSLLTPKVMQKKVEEEQELRQKVADHPEWKNLYGSSWDHMAEAYKKLLPMSKRIFYSNLVSSRLSPASSFFSNCPNSHLLTIALQLVQHAAEVTKPNSERLETYRDSNLESFKFDLLSPAPIYNDLEECLLSTSLQEMADELGPDDPFVKATVGSRSTKDVAQELIKGTTLGDVAARKVLLEGGQAAIEKSTDPMIVMARKMDPLLRELNNWCKENVASVRSAAGEKVAKARFAVYGRKISPDANFTVRLSYGVVKGYELGTTLVPYKTTYAGLYDRGASFDNQPPFNIAPKVLARKANVDLTTPLNFVYTADTIGGNSGSPVINRNGEIVGVNFDSNIHRFVSRYLYTEETGRAMGVHCAGILEALRKIYDAGPLADELVAGH